MVRRFTGKKNGSRPEKIVYITEQDLLAHELEEAFKARSGECFLSALSRISFREIVLTRLFQNRG
jgi:hypothetical protein